MTFQAGVPPWLAAWLATERDFASFAAAWARPAPAAAAIEAWQAAMTDRYRRLFVPPEAAPAVEGDSTGAAVLRYRAAAERFGAILTSIAQDAGRRLASALAESGPGAPPITTLRELHALWIECGEAAWSVAAHGEPFAAAQAELLGALVELRAAGTAR